MENTHEESATPERSTRQPIDLVSVNGTTVSHSPDGEWPRLGRMSPDSTGSDGGGVVISGPDHHGFL